MRIQTPNLGMFRMPGICVSCGRERGKERKRFSWSRVSFWRIQNASVEFPICPECYRYDKSAARMKLLVFSLFLLDFFILMPGVLLLTAFAGVLAEGTAVMILRIFVFAVLFYAMIALTAKLFVYITRERVSTRMRQRSSEVAGSVAIEKFGQREMTFDFRNPAFAEEFAVLNRGQVVD